MAAAGGQSAGSADRRRTKKRPGGPAGRLTGLCVLRAAGPLLLQQLGHRLGGAVQIVAGKGLDHAGVGLLGQLRVDGHLGQHRQAVLGAGLVHVAVAKDLDVPGQTA